MSTLYIHPRNWERFQHYKDRRPPWIKVYIELLDDDNYLALSEHRALLLHRIWLAYASSRSGLRVEVSSSTTRAQLEHNSTPSRAQLDTRSISRHCHLRVTSADLFSLREAGFIDILDSAALAPALAPGEQNASPRARPRARGEAEEETETEEPAPEPSPEASYEEPEREPDDDIRFDTPDQPNGAGAGAGDGLERLDPRAALQAAAGDEDLPF